MGNCPGGLGFGFWRQAGCCWAELPAPCQDRVEHVRFHLHRESLSPGLLFWPVPSDWPNQKCHFPCGEYILTVTSFAERKRVSSEVNRLSLLHCERSAVDVPSGVTFVEGEHVQTRWKSNGGGHRDVFLSLIASSFKTASVDFHGRETTLCHQREG